MNLKSEQIGPDLNKELAFDQVLSAKEQQEKLVYFLGKENCSTIELYGKKVFLYKDGRKKYILLHKAVSYLGGNGQHPVFKKRVQLPSWFKDFCNAVKKDKLSYDVRFIGVYHYKGGVIFVDFIKDTYLKKKVHNSSAHIYTNDIYQAMRNGVFHKEDMFGNHIYTIRSNRFKSYLTGKDVGSNDLFALFEKFNFGFPFGHWLTVFNAVKEMYDNKWSQWGQSEWAGWFLEYRFNEFTKQNKTSSLMRYTGLENKSKKQNRFDFDIWFDRDNFYGDLKSSDIIQKETPGNDISNFVECINLYDKFWYVIYEHDTQKDNENNNYADVRKYNAYLRKTDKKFKDKDDLSYAKKLKTKVKFVKMTILELNRINYSEALTVFNQGHQPDGSARNPKFMIKKKDMDKYSVFRYTYSSK